VNEPTETELWTAETPSGRVYRCVLRFAPEGVEAAVYEGDRLVARYASPSSDDASAWADEMRDIVN
jgi:hypothetical protein